MLLPLALLVTATQTPDAIRVSWQDERNLPWTAEFSKNPDKPLITAIRQGDKLIVKDARPFYWYRGSLVALGTLAGASRSAPMGMNDHGQSVGYCFTGPERERATLWQLPDA